MCDLKISTKKPETNIWYLYTVVVGGNWTIAVFYMPIVNYCPKFSRSLTPLK